MGMGVGRVQTGAGNPDGQTWEVALVVRRSEAGEVPNQDPLPAVVAGAEGGRYS